MVKNSMSPREQFLSALNLEQSNCNPCTFMQYKGLLTNSDNYLDFLSRQLDLGLMPYAMIPPRPPIVVNDHYNLHGMPVKFDPSVSIKEWSEARKGEINPVLVKEYTTPAGKLRAEIRKTEDWRWGDHVPIFDDYITPRTIKYLVDRPEDIEAFRYLLAVPSEQEIAAIRAESAPVIQFAHQHNLPLLGGWGVGADMLGWVFGFENMVYSTFEQPDFLKTILQLIFDWNQARMKVLLEIGIDIYIKRAWYETCNFWSPKTFRTFLLPILQQEAALAHHYGAKFGYIATDKVTPLFPLLAESGIDVLIGVDPHTFDLAATKAALGDKMCLWGGVNGHLTVEIGSEEATRAEVRSAMQTLSPGGGFILSPVDNVREYTETSKANVTALIDEWRNYCG